MSSLSAAPIYVFKDSMWIAEPLYGELHILDDITTTLHYSGHSGNFKTINFWLLDYQDIVPIRSFYASGTTTTYVDWMGNSWSVKIRELTVTDVLWDIKRPTSDYTVVRCTAKLQAQ